MFRDRMKEPWNRLADLVICITLVAAPFFAAYNYLHTQQRPRIIKTIWIEPAIIPVGGKFVVRIRASISKLCETQVHRWIIAAAGNQPVWESIAAGRPTQVGDESVIDVPLELDPTIGPGDYYYKSTVYDVCAEGKETYTTVPPFVYFKVVGDS